MTVGLSLIELIALTEGDLSPQDICPTTSCMPLRATPVAWTCLLRTAQALLSWLCLTSALPLSSQSIITAGICCGFLHC